MTNNRNAVITGAGKGIGKAIALSLAKAGYNLAICSRTLDDLEKLQKEIEILNPNIRVLVKKTDLGKKTEVFEFAKFVKSGFDDLDVLINNAGIFLPGSVLDEDDGSIETTMNINVYSAYHLTRQLMDLIKNNHHGHIFNMCSIASFMAYANGGSYTISKFALLGFSKVLREELKTEGIKVTSIMPGATWSHSWKGADLPDSRLMKPEDIAETVMSALRMSPSAVVEEIIIRPQLGDL